MIAYRRMVDLLLTYFPDSGQRIEGSLGAYAAAEGFEGQPPPEHDWGATHDVLLRVFFWGGLMPTDLTTLKDSPDRLRAIGAFIDELMATQDEDVLSRVEDFGMPWLAQAQDLMEPYLSPATREYLRIYVAEGRY